MPLSQSTHWSELVEVLRVALPLLIGGAVIATLIVSVAHRPPDWLRLPVLSWRREIVLSALAIPIGTVAALLVLYWAI